jgi:hypothetical protein
METYSQSDEIKATFKKRKRAQLIATAPAVLAFVFIGVMRRDIVDDLWGIPVQYLGLACAVIIIALLIFSFLNWRCPSCSSYLGRVFNPKFCSRCGAELR